MRKEDLSGPISGYRLDTHLKKKLIDIVENSLLPAKGRPTATYAHEIWLVDITFVSVREDFWYLIAVIDLYSRYREREFSKSEEQEQLLLRK